MDFGRHASVQREPSCITKLFVQVTSLQGLQGEYFSTLLRTYGDTLILEFLPDIIWQHPVLEGTLRLKNRIVFFNESVKENPLRTMAHISQCAFAWPGFPAGGQRLVTVDQSGFVNDRLVASAAGRS